MPGSCALASHIVMIWAETPYDLKLLSHEALASEAFRAINPKGAVPALSIGDGSTLRESLAILSYIADLNPRARLGAETVVERVRLNEILAELVSEVHTSWAPVFVPERYVLDDAHQEDARTAAFARIDEQYTYLEERLGDQDWLLFGRRTVADAYLYVMCRWKEKSPTPLSKYPALQRFMDRLDTDEGVRRALLEE
jgi:glutathione S-transferase